MVIAKSREHLSVSGQPGGINRLNIQSLTEEESAIKYAFEVTNRFAASDEMNDSDGKAMDRQ